MCFICLDFSVIISVLLRTRREMYLLLTRIELFTVLFLLFFASRSSAYPSGAPIQACETLTPNHGVEAQQSESPYRITTSATSVDGGETVLVEIEAEQGRPFKGFFLVARVNGANQNIGEFLLNEEETTPLNFRNCGDGIRNAATHANPELKPKISVNWKAPLNFAGNIRF